MPNDEQEIRDLVKNWLDASKAGDNEKVLSLMSEDVVFLVCGQPPMRGKAAFAAAQGPLDQFEFETQSEINEIKVLGDWAYIWTNLSLSITPRKGGATMKRSGYTLSILRKENGKWLLFRDANLVTPVS
jgi:uncharacterized protein (TIGR02246 family)